MNSYTAQVDSPALTVTEGAGGGGAMDSANYVNVRSEEDKGSFDSPLCLPPSFWPPLC